MLQTVESERSGNNERETAGGDGIGRIGPTANLHLARILSVYFFRQHSWTPSSNFVPQRLQLSLIISLKLGTDALIFNFRNKS